MYCRRYPVIILCTIFLLCLFPSLSPFHALGATAGPGDSVRRMLDEVMAIQNDPKLEGSEYRQERKKDIKAIISKNVDLDRMAEDALGDHWSGLDRKRQAEFAAIFRDLFQDSYTRLVLDFLKQEKIRYSPEVVKNREATVKTIIARPNEHIPVDYRLTMGKDRWLVRDVTIDGVSIVQKYRNSFDRVIRKSSYSVLLDKMRLQQRAIQDSP